MPCTEVSTYCISFPVLPRQRPYFQIRTHSVLGIGPSMYGFGKADTIQPLPDTCRFVFLGGVCVSQHSATGS